MARSGYKPSGRACVFNGREVWHRGPDIASARAHPHGAGRLGIWDVLALHIGSGSGHGTLEN